MKISELKVGEVYQDTNQKVEVECLYVGKEIFVFKRVHDQSEYGYVGAAVEAHIQPNKIHMYVFKGLRSDGKNVFRLVQTDEYNKVLETHDRWIMSGYLKNYEVRKYEW